MQVYYRVTERNPLMSSCLLYHVIFFKVACFRGLSFIHHASANCIVLPLVQTIAVIVENMALAFTKIKEVVLPGSQQRMILLRRFCLLEKETFLQ